MHAPCLLITQRVWGTEPWVKLERARAAAETLRAPTVVVHPPFRWQRDYARGFRQGIERLAEETDVRFAVENMFPLRVRGREVSAYAPDWDPTLEPHRAYTLDLSHTAVVQSDALELAATMGDRLAHVHIADGTGAAKDEHLVPGPRQPALRRAAGAAGPARLRRLGRGRGQHPPGRGPGRAGGRPGRGAGLHPAAPGRRQPRRLTVRPDARMRSLILRRVAERPRSSTSSRPRR